MMLDFGPISRAVQCAVFSACEKTDEYLDEFKEQMLPDTASGDTLKQWAGTLQIYTDENVSDEQLRIEILGRLNANGSVSVFWFYELARRLGFTADDSAHVAFSGSQSFKDIASLIWSSPVTSPVINICHGKFLPFRAGISPVRDKVYDNILYGATTICVIFAFPPEYESPRRKIEALISAFALSRSLGTVMFFYNGKTFLSSVSGGGKVNG